VALPSVVLNGDLELWVGEIEADHASPDPHPVLLRGARYAGSPEKLGDIHLFLAFAGPNPVETVGEYGAHDRAPAPAFRFERPKHAE
jgi:hypothetical protein